MELRPPEKRDWAIDIVRSLAILMVLSIHLGGAASLRPTGFSWADEFWKVFHTAGSYGVMAFFVVSGYLISQMIDRRNGSILRPGLRNFYAGRVARIAPLLSVIVFLGAVVLAVPVFSSLPGFAFCFHRSTAAFDWKFWLSLPTFSFNWLRIAREAKSFGFGLHWDLLWSLSVEEQFYLFYPLLLWRAGSRERLTRILWALVATGPLSRAAAYAYEPTSYLWGYTNSFVCLDLLAMGCLAYLYAEKYGDAWKRFPLRSCGLAAAGLALWLGTYMHIVDHPELDHLAGASVVGLGVALFLFGGRHVQAFLAERFPRGSRVGNTVMSVLTWPGYLSYGCYLWQTITLFLLLPVLAGQSFVMAYAIFIAATVLVATISHRLLERPAKRFLESRLAARKGKLDESAAQRAA